jgi:hypothetical protein
LACETLNSTTLLGNMGDVDGEIQPVLSSILNELKNLFLRHPSFNHIQAMAIDKALDINRVG